MLFSLKEPSKRKRIHSSSLFSHSGVQMTRMCVPNSIPCFQTLTTTSRLQYNRYCLYSISIKITTSSNLGVEVYGVCDTQLTFEL